MLSKRLKTNMYVCICTLSRCSIILNNSQFHLSLSISPYLFFHIYSLEWRNRRTGLIRFSQAIFKHKVTYHIFNHIHLIRQICFIQVGPCVILFFISLRKADRKSFTSLRGHVAFNADYSSATLSFICTLCLLSLC